MTAPRRRLIANELREQFDVSERCVSRALDLSRSSLRYSPVLRDEQWDFIFDRTSDGRSLKWLSLIDEHT
jgi:hypothetical protein